MWSWFGGRIPWGMGPDMLAWRDDFCAILECEWQSSSGDTAVDGRGAPRYYFGLFRLISPCFGLREKIFCAAMPVIQLAEQGGGFG